MFRLGPTELIIILMIVLLLFGVGRVARIGGELGQAVSSFRKGLQSNKDEAEGEGEENEGETTAKREDEKAV